MSAAAQRGGLPIALVGPAWPFRGGIAKTTTELARALTQRGDLAAFLTPERQYPPFLYPGGGDIDPGACPQLPQAQRVFSVMEPWTWPRLIAAVRRSGARALVFPYWTWAWAPLLAALQAGSGLPAVAIAHNAADHDAGRLAGLAARAVLGRCEAHFCHAHSVAAALAARHGAIPSAVYPEPPTFEAPVDRQEARAALGLAEGEVAALFFGLIRPYKGVEVLLDAAARLPEGAPVRIIIAGEPWAEQRAMLEARLGEAALARRVIAHLRWIPEEAAGAYFAAADALVLPYHAATGSGVVARGFAHGLPVVASAVGGLAETVVDGESGLLVPPGDGAALAQALGRLVDGELRAALSAGARQRGEALTWAGYADALCALVADVAGGS